MFGHVGGIDIILSCVQLFLAFRFFADIFANQW